MKKVSVNNPKETDKKLRPALNPEARENQLISLAVDQAEDMLRNGNAPAQVVVHYLRLAATKERYKLENELLKSKIESQKSQTRSENLFEEALNAFKAYSGSVEVIDDKDI